MKKTVGYSEEVGEFTCPWCGNGFIPRNDIAAFETKKAEIKRLEAKIHQAMTALRICSQVKLSNRHIIAKNALDELMK